MGSICNEASLKGRRRTFWNLRGDREQLNDTLYAPALSYVIILSVQYGVSISDSYRPARFLLGAHVRGVQAPVKGFEKYVGSRSTFESLNGFWVKELMDEKRGYRWNWRSRDTGLVLFELFEPWAFNWKTKTQIVDKDK